MAKSHDDVLGHYAEYFKNWQVKTQGSKPTRDMLAAIHGLGARPGKQAMANAMGLRPEGVTGSQIVITCGAPQLNKMRGFITDGYLKREAVPPTSVGHTVYKLTLTAKGNAKIGKAVKAEAPKADKPKATKPRKPVTPKVETPVPEVTPQPEAPQPQA